MQEVRDVIQATVKQLFNVDIEPGLTRPDEQFGDYATNVALQLAKQLNKNPGEIAKLLSENIKHPTIAKTEVAGPGFINIWLSDDYLIKSLKLEIAQSLTAKVVVVEYSDPNPFKVLHAGHLYTSVVGDSIANLLEVAGAKVHRVNYGGDVGLHVAKTMWAVLEKLGGEEPEKLKSITEEDRPEWLTAAYVDGNNAYEDDTVAKEEIVALNKKIYAILASRDHDSPLAQIYWTTRKWSYDYFDKFYARIGTKFEKYYPESEVVELGVKTVQQQLEHGIFKKSEGAIIFDGESHGLHTRVFINSEGLPTYEAKEVGLILTKDQDYHFDKSVIITGNDIVEYMKVVLKAVEQFKPALVNNTTHLTHGIVKLQGGTKMSSRKGNILRAVDVLDAAAEANKKATGKRDEQVELGAVKYAFLKNRTGGDIVYDSEESVSLQGNSGPYLQYAHARACSILAKTKTKSDSKVTDLQDGERPLVRKIGEYGEVVDRAVRELMPHHICTYLYELAQTFNRFYEENRVISDDREEVRLHLVQAYTNVLKAGLKLLNISAPEKM